MSTDTGLSTTGPSTRASHRSAAEPAAEELGGRWPWAGLVAATTLFAFPAVGSRFYVAMALAFTGAVALHRGGLPDHLDHPMYTTDAVAVLDVVVGQFQYTGLWPLTLVMAAVAAPALRQRNRPVDG